MCQKKNKILKKYLKYSKSFEYYIDSDDTWVSLSFVEIFFRKEGIDFINFKKQAHINNGFVENNTVDQYLRNL